MVASAEVPGVRVVMYSLCLTVDLHLLCILYKRMHMRLFWRATRLLRSMDRFVEYMYK